MSAARYKLTEMSSLPTEVLKPIENCALSCLSKVDNIYIKKQIHRAAFELRAPKTVIKGVFSRSHSCYGNLLCYKKDNNVYTNGWAVF